MWGQVDGPSLRTVVSPGCAQASAPILYPLLGQGTLSGAPVDGTAGTGLGGCFCFLHWHPLPQDLHEVPSHEGVGLPPCD